ncbi:jg10274, partial [Pararge aegeria aegeria]
MMLTKSPSPPPPLQRQARSDITAPTRPHASKAREAAPGKTIEKPQFGWNERMSTWKKIPVKGLELPENTQSGSKKKINHGQKNPIKG